MFHTQAAHNFLLHKTPHQTLPHYPVGYQENKSEPELAHQY